MYDRKKRLFKLIESYINEFYNDSVEKFYGKGTKIKIHSMTESFSQKTMLFELVVILGEEINESVMDKKMAITLFNNAIVYFFPDYSFNIYVRWDV
jgi:hypothetical protein